MSMTNRLVAQSVAAEREWDTVTGAGGPQTEGYVVRPR